MAIMRIDWMSRSLDRVTPLVVIHPHDTTDFGKKDNVHYQREPKTLFLLHGYSRYCEDWLIGSPIAELSTKYNLACGTEDFLLSQNRAFAQFLGEQGVDAVYAEGAGGHNWEFWNRQIEPVIQWLLKD